ncbi:MAG: CRISPR-associated endonuclease Cas2 [Bacteroidota bacterium]
MPHLICYDIHKNSLRAKMSKTIIAYGLDRINKSVYLGSIQAQPLRELEQKLSTALAKVNHPTDSLIIISVAPQAIQGMRIYGQNQLDREELAGEKTTLII